MNGRFLMKKIAKRCVTTILIIFAGLLSVGCGHLDKSTADAIGTIVSNILSGSESQTEAVSTPTPTASAVPTPAPGPKQSKYYIYKSNATWMSANSHAENMGGELVCINDAAEFRKACQLADAYNIKVFWVGAARNSSENWGTIYWRSGEPITYSNWYYGEPSYVSDKGEIEQYLMVFKVNGVWYFNDAVNDVSPYYAGKMGYIVEIKE